MSESSKTPPIAGEKEKKSNSNNKRFNLKVNVVKANKLVGSDGAVCSPYVKVVWGNKKKAQKTKVVTKSSDPEWNQSMAFEVKCDKYPEKKPDVEIEVYEHNKFSGDKLIGEVNYPITDTNVILNEPSNIVLPVILNQGTKHESKSDLSLSLTPNFGQDKAVVEKQRQIDEQKKMADVERQFALLVDQLANDPKAKEAMLKMDWKNKMLMIEQNKDKLSSDKTPDHFAVKLLRELGIRAKKSLTASAGSTPSSPTSSSEGMSVSDLKDISVALRSRGLDWIRQFHKLEATTRLVELLNVINLQPTLNEESIQQQFECLSCIKNIMNNKIGIQFILSVKNSFKVIGACLGSTNDRVNELAIALLNAINFASDNGHKIIIEVMNNNKVIKGEKRRFISLVSALRSKLGQKETRESLKMKSIYLSFINVIVNSPPEIDLRLSLRQEFYWLGLKEIIADLSKYEYDESPELDTQITVFEEEENKDSKEMADRFNEFPGLNLTSIDDTIKALMDKIKITGLVDTFREIVKDLLLLPANEDLGLRTWLVASRIIKQISLRDKNIGVDEDFIVPLDNLLLTCEQEAKELPLRAKIEDLSKGSQDLNKKVAAQELELKEKIDLVKKYEETSAKQLEELSSKLKSKEDDIKMLLEQIETLKARPMASVTATPVGADLPSSGGPPPPPPPPGGPPPPPPPPGGPPPPPPPPGGPPPPPPPPGGPPPPPPPPGGGPPPPPPPPGGPPGPPPPPGGPPGPPPPPGGFGKKAAAPARKQIPLPGMKMKGLQWTSLNDKKIQGTVFSKFTVDSSKDINLDYKEIEEAFQAKVIEKKESSAPKKSGPVAIIDGKTSQNLSIFLSQFKGKSFDDICGAINRGDELMFQSNHIDALITFLPSDDDINNINEFLKEEKDVTKLGTAEQFSLKINAVPSVKTRLTAMKFRFGYGPKKSDIKLDIANFRTAVKELSESTKIPKIIEIILILGNFINGGTPRGNAFGFKLNTITKLADTKSTDNKMSLINYLAKVLQKDFNSLTNFAEELKHVEPASKISMSNLLSEIATLRKDFLQVQKTIETLAPSDDQDTFKSTFETFLKVAQEDIDQITDNSQQMETEFRTLATNYGEDPKIDPSEFLMMFVKFVEQYDKSTKENEQLAQQAEKIAKREAAKKLKEEEDAKKKQAAEERKKKGASEEVMPEAVVDDLLNTIASGDAFKNRRRAGRGARAAQVDLDSIEIEV
ncbi:actin binding protein [Heterostelium album PN500]|uniref:Actin binding protein n=1 Tax=Heterostelium pallidum (strain ATCC 26659 / Pp 5 / PN500) TaxID=670386 RepID=D3B650_HETP5|nr:actin binding protein [Heterostelium album PN500]EFA83348.1 actin binding protein [Heterostelium album PN500]|eukprot:XP_020435465.1 actin binding protein [Heterostelium album PN500]